MTEKNDNLFLRIKKSNRLDFLWSLLLIRSVSLFSSSVALCSFESFKNIFTGPAFSAIQTMLILSISILECAFIAIIGLKRVRHVYGIDRPNFGWNIALFVPYFCAFPIIFLLFAPEAKQVNEEQRILNLESCFDPDLTV